MTGDVTSRQIVPKSPACPEGLFLMDGIEGLRSLPKHSVDMLLTDPPYGTMSHGPVTMIRTASGSMNGDITATIWPLWNRIFQTG